jgi:hypothetical protein
MFSGLGAGIMWFIMYSSYAIAFWYGVKLILESREKGDYEYTPAILVIVSTKNAVDMIHLTLYVLSLHSRHLTCLKKNSGY